MRAMVAISPRETTTARRALGALSFVLLLCGSAALGYATYRWFDLYRYQRVAASEFEIPKAVLPPSAPAVAASIAVGDVIGEIDVPRLKLKAVVVQGDSEDQLRRSVGHLPETALPGEAGNVALAAHRDGLFRPLRNVRPGDAIFLQTRNRKFEYKVEWTAVVAPNATRVIEPTSESALTLVTCFPFYYVGAAPKRFIVRAREISTAPPPPGSF